MQKLLMALFSVILISSCSLSNEKKAQKLITQHLKETLNDWSSYESVKFGTLDTTFTTFDEDSSYMYASTQFESFIEKSNKALDDMKDYAGMTSVYYENKFNFFRITAQIYLDSAEVYAPIVDSIRTNFIPVFYGWSMTHSFRANNAMGNKIIGHFKYYFDPEITAIKKSEDIGEK